MEENEEEQYKLGIPQKIEVMAFRELGTWGEFLPEQKIM